MIKIKLFDLNQTNSEFIKLKQESSKTYLCLSVMFEMIRYFLSYFKFINFLVFILKLFTYVEFYTLSIVLISNNIKINLSCKIFKFMKNTDK